MPVAIKTSCISLLLMLVLNTASGQADSLRILDRSYYLKKSKTQKTIAHVLMGLGIAAILAPRELETFSSTSIRNFTIGGSALILTSIGFHYAAHMSRQKSRYPLVQLQLQQVPALSGRSLGMRIQPSMAISFPF